jgi:alkanesulfonate monooxygenase SsuD/methylene tetrahydromethanopterin reductase-like flavin-dependent oxidoreductase (luciferase family)
LLKHDPSLPDAAVDLEYVADHLWLTGSPGTVAERVRNLQEQTGGFGYLLAVSYDAADERTAWERHLDLLIHEVLPACSAPAVTAVRG